MATSLIPGCVVTASHVARLGPSGTADGVPLALTQVWAKACRLQQELACCKICHLTLKCYFRNSAGVPTDLEFDYVSR